MSLYKQTLSFGRRLIVFNGRKTRSTLRDLMVLMSFPLLLPLHVDTRTATHPRASRKKKKRHTHTHTVS